MNELLDYQNKMLMQPRIGSLDYDTGRTWYLRVPWESFWDDTIDLIRLEAKRIHDTFPKVGNLAVIYRSSFSGWHLYFPHADMTWKENENLLFFSRAHRGFVRFSQLVTDCTLRVSPKPGADAPYIVEVIHLV